MNASQDFDFDEWADLARQDTAAFEQRRRLAIEETLVTCRDVECLTALQCRIDLERRRARTPLKSCLRLTELMWGSFYRLNDVLQDLWDAPLHQAVARHLAAPRSAEVIRLAERREPFLGEPIPVERN